MATLKSMARISTKLRQTLLSTHKISSSLNKSFFSTSTTDYSSDLDELPPTESPLDSLFPKSSELGSNHSSSPSSDDKTFNNYTQTLLEGGLDHGIYKAVIVGQVGQNPIQKTLRNGKKVTLTTVGTGGLRSERIPFPGEEPKEYADRCTVQWHRVSVYPERLGDVVFKHAQPGGILYLEGNLETKIYTDPTTGLVRRIREIAIRRNGRVVFLGNRDDFSVPSPNELKGVGYF